MAELLKNVNESLLEGDNALALYIENNFCESILNEEANAIQESIFKIYSNESCSIEDVLKVTTSISEANLNHNTKSILLSNLYEAFKYCSENTAAAENYMLEFSGNPEKNKVFIEALNKVEKYINDWHDDIKLLLKLGDSILDACEEAAKTPEDNDKIKASYNKAKSAVSDYIKQIQSDKYKSLWADNNKELQKYFALAKKFNNIYGTEPIAAMEAIDKKLDKLINDVYTGEIRNWAKFTTGQKVPYFDRLVAADQAIRNKNKELAGQFASEVINPYLNSLYNTYKQFENFVIKIRAGFNIEVKYTKKYEIIQRFLKSKGEKVEATEKK